LKLIVNKIEHKQGTSALLCTFSPPKFVKRLALQKNEGISSSDVESRQLKKTKSGGSYTHNNTQVIADMGKARSEAKIAATQRKDKTENDHYVLMKSSCVKRRRKMERWN
jgi:hypothetical protein